jgi:hypothetical protein
MLDELAVAFQPIEDLRSTPSIPLGLAGREAERQWRNLSKIEFQAQRGTAARRVTQRALCSYPSITGGSPLGSPK